MDTGKYNALLSRAGAILSRRAYSRADLQHKLEVLSDTDQVEAVLNRLEQLNLLNDADYAYNFALHRIRQQGWSPQRVEHALVRHRVAMSIIRGALERTIAEVGGQPAMIREYVEKHCGRKGLPKDPKGIRKLLLHLRQRGFDEESILDALKGLMPAVALQPFETGD